MIYINLHNKLSLPEAQTSSRALLTIFHIALAINWAFALMHLYPVVGILPCSIILAIENKRKTPFTNSALKFAISRFYIHVTLITIVILYSFLNVDHIVNINQAWFLLSYILTPLAIYDAYCTSKGGLGLNFLRPIKETLRKRSTIK